MRRLPIAALLLGTLTFAGCTVGPKYKRPTVDAPTAFRGTAPDLSPANESLANQKWWTVFSDPQLQTLIRTALANNYDLRLAGERVVAAQAQLGITRADQFPTLNAGGDLNTFRQQITPLAPAYRDDSIELQANATWELDFWGKYRRATEAARATLAATDWGRQEVVRALVASVATDYFQLRALDLELDITRQTLKSRQESLRLTKLLAAHGAISDVDVRQAEQLVFTASAAIPQLEREIEQQENALTLLLGQNPGPIARGQSLLEQPQPQTIPAGLPSQLLTRRPDIQQAEQTLIAANAKIGVARAQYFPTISLTGDVGTSSTALTSLFSAPSRLWSFGPTLSVPIFNAGRVKNNVRLTEAEQREAVISYQKTVQTAFHEVSDALVACRKTREQRIEQQHLVESARAASHLSQVRYEGGATAYLEVLTSETTYYSAQLNLIQVELDQRLALVQLYKALGGGWQQ